MPLSAGGRLGPYEIVAPLGAGGMGEVYKARDTRLERTVAIKILPAAVAEDAEARFRFEREARAIASLDHPHICAIYDVGEHDGVHYLVMQHLDGETLAARLDRAKGPLPLGLVLSTAIAVADALHKTHRAGITHRDLKPGNIMLTKAGAKLLDFGLAKLRGPDVPISMSGMTQLPTATPTTARGTLLGTVQYMAPEQVEGRDADARSDVWAFGAVLYEMTTGQRPFDGDSAASLIGAILKDHPQALSARQPLAPRTDRKSTRLNSSHLGISYAVFCLKKKKWIERYLRHGVQGLEERSRRPRHSPHATAPQVVAAIVECRKRHP